MKKLICMLGCLMLYSVSYGVIYFEDGFEWTNYADKWDLRTQPSGLTVESSATQYRTGARSLHILDADRAAVAEVI